MSIQKLFFANIFLATAFAFSNGAHAAVDSNEASKQLEAMAKIQMELILKSKKDLEDKHSPRAAKKSLFEPKEKAPESV